MKNDATPAAADTTTETIAKAEPKSQTITLHSADGTVMYIVAERKAVGARTYVILTTPDKKTSRGMSENHATFEEAKTAIAASAAKAEKLGWHRRTAGRIFTPKPDAFSSLPPAIKATAKGKK